MWSTWRTSTGRHCSTPSGSTGSGPEPFAFRYPGVAPRACCADRIRCVSVGEQPSAERTLETGRGACPSASSCEQTPHPSDQSVKRNQAEVAQNAFELASCCCGGGETEDAKLSKVSEPGGGEYCGIGEVR